VIEVFKGITRVIVHFGFMESNITIAAGLQAACDQGKICGIDPAASGQSRHFWPRRRGVSGRRRRATTLRPARR
jgi:hypothetical protein